MNPATLKWKAIDCQEERPFICVNKVRIPQTRTFSTTVAPAENTSDKEVEVDGLAYSIHMNSKKQTNARSTCHTKDQDGGDWYLAAFNSLDEIRAIQTHIRDSAEDVWIGRYRVGSGRFFVNGKGNASFFNWDQGEPNNETNTCVVMNVTTLKWKVIDCEEERPFICVNMVRIPPSRTFLTTVAPTANTRDTQVEVAGVNYSIHMRPTTRTNARSTCHAKDVDGGDWYLAAFNSLDEIRAIQPHIRRSSEDFWIGRYMGASGDFRVNGNGNESFWNWDQGEPNNESNTCVVMNVTTLKWKTIDCEEERPFICVNKVRIPLPRTFSTTVALAANTIDTDVVVNGVEYSIHMDTKTELGATLSCHSKRGNWYLAAFSSMNELRALQPYLRNSSIHFWVGRDKGSFGRFRISGHGNDGFWNWDQGEPKNQIMETCVAMNPDTLKWKVVSCFNLRPFICVNKPTEPVSTTDFTISPPVVTAAETKVVVDGANYSINMDAKDFVDAALSCYSKDREGGDWYLASFSSLDEMRALQPHISDSRKIFWIGRIRDSLGEMTVSKPGDKNFWNWDLGEPNYSPLNRCVAMDPVTLKWKVHRCLSEQPFICVDIGTKPTLTTDLFTITPTGLPMMTVSTTQSPYSSTASPTENSVFLDGDMYFIDNSYQTWTNANHACLRKGTGVKLASFSSMEDLRALQPYINGRNQYFWIGRYRDNTGVFRSLGKREENFWNWNQGEPSNNGQENCTVMFSETLLWNDVRCEQRRPFICVKVNALGLNFDLTTEIPASDAKKTAVKCGPMHQEWKYHNDYCYLAQATHETSLDWYSAEEFCNREMSHLVSVHNQDEWNFISTQMLEEDSSVHNLWSGLMKHRNGSFSSWTDKSSLDFVLLKNGTGNLEGCISLNLRFGWWTINPCVRAMGFICKIPHSLTLLTEKNAGPTLRAYVESNSNIGMAAGIGINIILTIFIISILIFLLLKRWPVDYKCPGLYKQIPSERKLLSEEQIDTL